MPDPRSTWHPIMAAEEGPTATWHLVAGLGEPYATIDLRRVLNGSETRYRVTFGGEVIAGQSLSVWPASSTRGVPPLARRGGGPVASWGAR